MTNSNDNDTTDIKIISVSFQYMTQGFVTREYRTLIYLSLIYINELFGVIRRYEFSYSLIHRPCCYVIGITCGITLLPPFLRSKFTVNQQSCFSAIQGVCYKRLVVLWFNLRVT